MTKLIYPNIQPELDNQKPSVNYLRKDKLGGTEFQAVEVQSNRLSRHLLSSIWFETIILSTSLPEVLTKSFVWFGIGVVASLLTQLSFTATLFAMPIVWFVLWIIYETRNTHLQGSVLFLTIFFIFGFVLSFLG